MTHEFHNPDNLTPEQIGEGYRLLLKSEIKPRPENREINAWLGRFRRWTGHNDSMCVGSSQDLTYRVPLSTWPLPGSKWQAEREALSRGECVEAQLASDWAPDTWIRLDPNFEGDWGSLFAVRARPWTLGNSVNGFTLSEGQQWRKTREPWKWDDLPPTFRPFTTLDVITAWDQFQLHGKTEWHAMSINSDFGEKPKTSHKFRTRRPLPPTPRDQEESRAVLHALSKTTAPEDQPWIPWHGGECPLRDDEVEEWEYKIKGDARQCKAWQKPSTYVDCWAQNGRDVIIIAYRVLKWKKSVSLPTIETFSAAMESVTKQESPPTDNDSWECLLRTNAQLGKKVVELEKDSDFWKSRYEDAINTTSFIQEEKESLGLLVGQDTVTDGILALRRQRNELQSKLTAAQARLKQLEWVPYCERKPTKADAVVDGCVTATDGQRLYALSWDYSPLRATHWLPFAPPAPIWEQVEFENFIKERGDGYMPKTHDELLELWNAARKEEKV